MPSKAIIRIFSLIQGARPVFPVRWFGSVSLRLSCGILAWVVLTCGPTIGTAARLDLNIAGLCDRAAIEASHAKGVPLDVLRAISRTETGRAAKSGLHPWPWTVNMEGTGRWFATLDEARSYVFLHFKNGARSFDVGCFQINYRWHGEAFRSIDDMFDPILNAQYAAEFLIALYREFGNWADAAGAYHSRTPELASKYATRFDRIRAGLSGDQNFPLTYQADDLRLVGSVADDLPRTHAPRPLMQGGSIALGSLVPIIRETAIGAHPFVVIK